MGGLNAAVSVGQEVASGQSVSAGAALSSFTAGFAIGPVAMLAGGDAETTAVTNDESTWTSATPVTASEQCSLAYYVGEMGRDYVNSAIGGKAEVSIQATPYSSVNADILSNDGAATEVKVGAVQASGYFAESELPGYLAARNSGAISDFGVVFLKSPSTGLTGPSELLGNMLGANGVSYARVPYDWWDAMQ